MVLLKDSQGGPQGVVPGRFDRKHVPLGVIVIPTDFRHQTTSKNMHNKQGYTSTHKTSSRRVGRPLTFDLETL